MADKLLPLDIDFEIDWFVERKNSTTRAWEPATGLTSVSGRISLTKTGAAVGSCTASLTEAGTTARYVGVIDTATLVAALAAQDGVEVYLILSKSGDFDRVYGSYTVVRQLAS
jgi:hypothetical protein